MGQPEGKTARVDRARRAVRSPAPAGLLQIYPLGDPPGMTFWPLNSADTSIGCAAECTIALDDEEASRRHATLRRAGDDWEIVDCDSANGLFVGGQAVRRATLRGGELVRVGVTLLRFLREGTAAARQRHPVHAEGMVAGPSLERTRALLDKAAASTISVLIVGETGTGKELAVRHLHDAGPRAVGPFVAVNCSAIPREMVESELFGHVKGAFTGAAVDNPGLLRQADGGTMFLDEIGELPRESQAKLLRVLQERRVRPLGSQRPVAVDLRLVSATNRELPEQIRGGNFRPDLYARIAELVVTMPPLRERLEDVPLLATHFVRKHAHGAASVSVDALELLCTRPWPFNIRELESAVRRALLLAEGYPELLPEHFEDAEAMGPASGAAAADEPPRPAPPLSAEAQALAAALRAAGGDASRAAAALGLSRSQLYRRAKSLGLRVGDFKAGGSSS